MGPAEDSFRSTRRRERVGRERMREEEGQSWGRGCFTLTAPLPPFHLLPFHFLTTLPNPGKGEAMSERNESESNIGIFFFWGHKVFRKPSPSPSPPAFPSPPLSPLPLLHRPQQCHGPFSAPLFPPKALVTSRGTLIVLGDACWDLGGGRGRSYTEG